MSNKGKSGKNGYEKQLYGSRMTWHKAKEEPLILCLKLLKETQNIPLIKHLCS